MTAEYPNFLKRYTDIPALIYLLRTKSITLLDPKTWEDKNDSHFLTLYLKKKHLKSVLGLCFTSGSETFHHWKVFAGGNSGVCIEFKGVELVRALRKRGLRAEKVRYLKLEEIRHMTLKTEELPFRKRFGYKDEREFRVIFDSKHVLDTFDVPISLSSIKRIMLSPSIPDALSDKLKEVIYSIDGCENVKVTQSRLISNQEWRNHGEKAK